MREYMAFKRGARGVYIVHVCKREAEGPAVNLLNTKVRCTSQDTGIWDKPADDATGQPPRDQPAPDPARCFDCPVDPAPAAQ